MEKFQLLRDQAKKTLHNADHMLTMTYPMLNENKLLLLVLTNIGLSVEQAMSSVLEYELLFKRIPLHPDTFEAKFAIFRDKVAKKYKIDSKHINMIISLRELTVAHRDSAVEFARKDKYIVANSNFELKTLSPRLLKDYVSKAKLFVDEMYRITDQNDGIFTGQQRRT